MKLLKNGHYLLILLIMSTGPAASGEVSPGVPPLLPAPQVIQWSGEKFPCNNENLYSDPRIRKVTVESLADVPANTDEAYRLVVTGDSVLIYAAGEEGFFRAASTLEQLMMTDSAGQYIAGCRITDWPAFRIRGFMHDCGRSFIPLDELKREIDILSGFKINTFHWHLTEDIAWRLASDIVPELTSPSVSDRDRNGYYTKEEVADFVKYCDDHFVNVIPEIDMPGHSAAFSRATGLTMQSDEGKEIVRQLLDEACRLFTGRFFHIGTDEVDITDHDFIREMMAVVRNHGKEVIGWLPGGEMDENAIRQLWADVALPAGTEVIDSRYRYLNHTDYYSDLFSIYNSRICDSQSGSDLLAGGICCIWNDRKPASVEDILVSNAFYPMMLAFAERSWAGGGEDIKGRGVRMGLPGDPAFERFRDFETRMMSIREQLLTDVPFPYLPQTGILWRISSQYPNGGDSGFSAPFESDLINNPGSNPSAEKDFRPAAGASVYLRHTWGDKVPAFYSDPEPDHTAYAYSWIYSPDDMEAGLHFSTHNYGRSELDMAPPQGEWDYKRSRVWINGEQVSPPVWKSPVIKPDHETPYTNENMWSRPPAGVRLRKGWNSLVIKLPVGKFSTPETRLVKWMFTAMIVTPDGKRQPEGIIYSPEKLFPDDKTRIACIGNSVTCGAGVAGGPYNLMVTTSSDTVIIWNILAGEVWSCPGQSNMEWPVSRSLGWEEARESCADENLTIINFSRRPLDRNQPWDSITLKEINNLDFFEEGTWSAASPESLSEFSAVAYYFGRKLGEELGVPVRLIEMAVGGSPAEAWIERRALEMHPQQVDLLYDYRKSEFMEPWVRNVVTTTLQHIPNPRQRHPFEPAYLFESGLSYIAGFPVKGFIWYLGESNANFPGLYEAMLPAMVRNWRESWGDNTLPFYFAQLSSLNRPSWPEFRNVQRRLATLIPESGMVVNADVGHPTDVHPGDKKSVGERFTSLALNDTYGFRKAGRSPEPVVAERRGNMVVLTFRPSGRLKTSDGLPVRETEVSESGSFFKSATARIRSNRLEIEAPAAVAVRYGRKPYAEGNLTGESGLPVPTFRIKIN